MATKRNRECPLVARGIPARYPPRLVQLGNVFDVTSVGQRSSSWPLKVEVIFHLEGKLPFVSAKFTMQQMHWTNLSASIEAKCWVSRWQIVTSNEGEDELWKLPWIRHLCAVAAKRGIEVTTRQKSACPRCSCPETGTGLVSLGTWRLQRKSATRCQEKYCRWTAPPCMVKHWVGKETPWEEMIANLSSGSPSSFALTKG